MLKILAAGLTALAICAAPAYAQTSSTQNRPSAEDLKAATETRIEITKAALQMTPAQEKLWPAVEEAIRSRAAARHQRLTTLVARLNDDRDPNPFAMMRERADTLSQRSVTLKKLVDAWQPLYETLDTRQKLRVRFLVTYSLREVRDLVAGRLEEIEESEEW
jgi:ribosomal 50S subunit-associated protein YjgA (DUF615 family)